jgi:hypothetical protein
MFYSAYMDTKQLTLNKMDLEELFKILRDGQWHDLNDLADRFGVNADKLAMFVQFMSDQGIIEYENKINRIKIEPEWQLLLPIDNKTMKPN